MDVTLAVFFTTTGMTPHINSKDYRRLFKIIVHRSLEAHYRTILKVMYLISMSQEVFMLSSDGFNQCLYLGHAKL